MGYNTPGNVQYNYAQLEGIWQQAGGSPGAAPIAAAIAMAESGGNTTATNQDSNGSVDRGLWQINSVHGNQSTYDVMGNARAAIAISNNGQNWSPWTTYTSGAYRQYIQTNVAADTSAPINATNAQANQQANLAFDPFSPLPGGNWDPANWLFDPLGPAGAVGGAAVGAATGSGLGQDAISGLGSIFGSVGGTLVKYLVQGLITTILNPMIQLAAGVAGITAGGAMVVIGIYTVAKNTETGQQVERGVGSAAQAGMMAFGPETTAATKYVGQEGRVTTVTQQRRQAGNVRIGGRPIQYRPARVQTTVERDTPTVLKDEANQYNNRSGGGETQRTTRSRPYGYGRRMGPPRPARTGGRG